MRLVYLLAALPLRTNTERKGTANRPVEVQTAVSEATSTVRSPLPYQSAISVGFQTVFGSSATTERERLGRRSPSRRGLPICLAQRPETLGRGQGREQGQGPHPRSPGNLHQQHRAHPPQRTLLLTKVSWVERTQGSARRPWPRSSCPSVSRGSRRCPRPGDLLRTRTLPPTTPGGCGSPLRSTS
jgi:hypothetical protein